MKVTFLGTAAAEGIPALWCECPLCARAKKLGGKEFRSRCSYLVDSDTMVDFGPDAFRQVAEFQIDLTRLERVIFTHPVPNSISTYSSAITGISRWVSGSFSVLPIRC